jgi:putative ABC transport system permease protein
VNLLVALRFAVRGLGANKLRSMLTTLGILIGVASVIILLAVGTGSTAAVKAGISRLGTNTLTVNRSAAGNGRGGAGGGSAGARGGAAGGTAAGGAATGGAGASGAAAAATGPRTQSTNLTLADAYALTDHTTVPDAAAVAPVVTAQSVVASYTGVTHTVGSFVGTSPSYLSINNDTAAAGTLIADSDFVSHAAVADLGATVAKDLFGGDGSAAVNKTVQLNGKDYLVQGVLQAKGSSGIQDQDDVIIAPLTSVQDELTGLAASLSNITVQATGTGAVDAAQSEIQNVLDSRHHVTSATRDYTVLNQASIIATATSTTGTLTVLLGAVAAISLLVGGIGVMNIMLVTVTERTREIGIRKAIGAGRGDILVQFIAEAVLLSIVGGLVGVAIGLIGSRFRIVGVQPVVEAWSVFLAFGVAVAVGLFFGIYPANRAASLRPIDALRYE